METIPPQSRMAQVVRAWALAQARGFQPIIEVLLPRLPARGGAARAE